MLAEVVYVRVVGRVRAGLFELACGHLAPVSHKGELAELKIRCVYCALEASGELAPLAPLLEMCRCGHDRGDHLDQGEHACDTGEHGCEGEQSIWPCVCRAYEAARTILCRACGERHPIGGACPIEVPIIGIAR